MKSKILTAALAFAVMGGSALAQSCNPVPNSDLCASKFPPSQYVDLIGSLGGPIGCAGDPPDTVQIDNYTLTGLGMQYFCTNIVPCSVIPAGSAFKRFC